MIGEKELYCSIDNECKKDYFVGGSLKFETNPELFSEHLEGDRRVCFMQNIQLPKVLALSLSKVMTLIYL